MGLPKANSTSILLFLLSLVMLRVSRCIKITYKHSPVEFPMELLLVGIVYSFIQLCLCLTGNYSGVVLIMFYIMVVV